MNFPLLQLGPVGKLSAVALGFFTLASCSGFCWYQWKMVKRYRGFPSKRLDVNVWQSILETYRKDVPLAHGIFSLLVNSLKSFQNEGLCVLWFIKPYLCVYSGKHMKNLVNEAHLADKASILELIRLLFGSGLITSKHDIWKVHRKWLNQGFNVSVLRDKMTVLNEHARQLADKLDTLVDQPVDCVFQVLVQYAYQSMADYIFDLNYDSEKHKDLAENGIKLAHMGGEQFLERAYRPWIHNDFMLPFFRSGRKYLKFIKEAHQYIGSFVKELMEKDHTSSEISCRKILMNRYQGDRSLTELEVHDHVMNLIAGAYDTVAIAMMWCLYLLGHHPEIQDKAYNEVMSIASGGDLTYEDLSKLKYLDCVIKETLRLYPSVPAVARKATKDIQCGEYTIPKGADVVFFIFMLHRDPEVFPDPEKFDPERFSVSSAIRPWMYIPFAEGYRSCIGKRFALVEMKIQLVHILSRFKISSLNQVDCSDLYWALILKPTKPLLFLFEDRRQLTEKDT